MNATDTEFYAAFAGRVRQQLATNTREGGPTMSATDIAETTTTVPASLQAAPDAPCEAHTWCIKTGAHVDHFGREVSLPAGESLPPVLEAYLYSGQDTGLPTLTFDRGHDAWQEYTSGDQLREETAKVRAHLARLDAFADQYDAIREADPTTAPARTCDKHAWCVEEDRREADTAHAGPMATLAVPEFEVLATRRPEHLMQVQLWATETEPSSAPGAYIAIDDTGEFSRMNADQMVAFADSLAAFREQVLAMAAQLREGGDAR